MSMSEVKEYKRRESPILAYQYLYNMYEREADHFEVLQECEEGVTFQTGTKVLAGYMEIQYGFYIVKIGEDLYAAYHPAVFQRLFEEKKSEIEFVDYLKKDKPPKHEITPNCAFCGSNRTLPLDPRRSQYDFECLNCGKQGPQIPMSRKP